MSKVCPLCRKPHEAETKCCLKCLEYNRRYYHTHREYFVRHARKWYLENREKVLQTSHKYRKENREYCLEYNKKYFEENRNRCLENSHRDYKQNREHYLEYARNYQKTHPYYDRAKYQKKRIRKQINGGNHTQKELSDLFNQQNGCCYYCDKLLYASFERPFHVEHKIPLSRGGSNNIYNIVLACASCNQKKHMKTEQEFLVEARG